MEDDYYTAHCQSGDQLLQAAPSETLTSRNVASSNDQPLQAAPSETLTSRNVASSNDQPLQAAPSDTLASRNVASNNDQPLQAAPSDTLASRNVASSNENTSEAYEMLNMDTQENSNEYEQLQVNEAYEHTTNALGGRDRQKREDNHYVKVTMKALKKILIATVLANTLILVSITVAVITLSVFTYRQSITAESTGSQIQQLETTTQANISQILEKLDTMQDEVINLQGQLFCGTGRWHRVAYLNMKDLTEQCPTAWREYNENGVRACGRPFSTQGSCATTNYSSSYEYSKVCGRVIGYQVASPDAFERFGDDNINIDGVNITSGNERQHVWSFVAGISEGLSSRSGSNCPCSNTSDQQSGPQQFIGDNFFCESGNPSNNNIMDNQFFSADPLWDGQQCEGNCCTDTNSPPWFNVQLLTPTNGDIQVSICGDEITDNEDTPIGLLEIFVQ